MTIYRFFLHYKPRHSVCWLWLIHGPQQIISWHLSRITKKLFPCHSPHETWNYAARVQHELKCTNRDIYRRFHESAKTQFMVVCADQRLSICLIHQLSLLLIWDNYTTYFSFHQCHHSVYNYFSSSTWKLQTFCLMTDIYSQKDDYTNINHHVLWSIPNIFWLYHKRYAFLP
jgi:hypothetical protein